MAQLIKCFLQAPGPEFVLDPQPAPRNWSGRCVCVSGGTNNAQEAEIGDLRSKKTVLLR